MADFLDELQEELRQERFLKLWNQYGLFVILGGFLILVATGAYLAWKTYQEKRVEDHATQYQEALELLSAQKKEEAQAIFKNLETVSDGYRLLAQLRTIASYSEAFVASPSEALLAITTKKIEEVMKEQGVDVALKGIFTAHMSLALLKASFSDEALTQALDQQMTPHNPWKGLALEATLLKALQQKELVNAKNLLPALFYAQDVPSALQTRVALELIGAGLSIPLPNKQATQK